MRFSEEKLQVLETVDRAFDLGTKENYILNQFLLYFNLLLVLFLVADLIEYRGYFVGEEGFHSLVRNTEIIFGMVFLMEFTLRSVFVYIPDKKFFSSYSLLNMAVIVSLLAPQFIGNLAILRLIQLFKIYKVYKLNKDSKSYHVDMKQVIKKVAEPLSPTNISARVRRNKADN